MAEDDRILRFENGSVGSNYAQIPRLILKILNAKRFALGADVITLKLSDAALLLYFAERIFGHAKCRKSGAFRASCSDLSKGSGLSQRSVRISARRLADAGLILQLSRGTAPHGKSVWAFSSAIMEAIPIRANCAGGAANAAGMDGKICRNRAADDAIIEATPDSDSGKFCPHPLIAEPNGDAGCSPISANDAPIELQAFAADPRTPSQELFLKKGARPQEPGSPDGKAEPEPGAPALPDFRMEKGRPEPTLEDLEDAVRRLLGTDSRITDETLQRMLPSFGQLKREIPRIAHEVRRCI